MSVKEKLRSYVFSKVDDDDASFDDSSPMKDADKASDDLNYERWYAALHRDRIRVRLDSSSNSCDCQTCTSKQLRAGVIFPAPPNAPAISPPLAAGVLRA